MNVSSHKERMDPKRIVVIKYGGHVMSDPDLRRSFAEDVASLSKDGTGLVIVHGGGPQIDSLLSRLSITTSRIAGMRVTPPHAMDAVEMALGLVGKETASLLSEFGSRAISLSGRDARLIVGTRHPGIEAEGRLHDLGRVGVVTSVDSAALLDLIGLGFVPVIAPIAVGNAGEALNINADTAAGAVAKGIGAPLMVMLTDISGVKDDAGNVISRLTRGEAHRLIEHGTIRDGMIPKVQAGLDALSGGVERCLIADGRKAGVLKEILDQSGHVVAGTTLLNVD